MGGKGTSSNCFSPPRADVRWVGQRLALLSVDQIHDSFRAAGYTPEQVDIYTKAVQKRIVDLNML